MLNVSLFLSICFRHMLLVNDDDDDVGFPLFFCTTLLCFAFLNIYIYFIFFNFFCVCACGCVHD